MPQLLIKIGTLLWRYGGLIITGIEYGYKAYKKSKVKKDTNKGGDNNDN